MVSCGDGSSDDGDATRHWARCYLASVAELPVDICFAAMAMFMLRRFARLPRVKSPPSCTFALKLALSVASLALCFPLALLPARTPLNLASRALACMAWTLMTAVLFVAHQCAEPHPQRLRAFWFAQLALSSAYFALGLEGASTRLIAARASSLGCALALCLLTAFCPQDVPRYQSLSLDSQHSPQRPLLQPGTEDVSALSRRTMFGASENVDYAPAIRAWAESLSLLPAPCATPPAVGSPEFRDSNDDDENTAHNAD